MTSFGTELTTGNETYRFVMRSTDGMSLLVFRNTLLGLDRLLWAVGVGTELEQSGSVAPGLYDVRSAESKGELWASGSQIQGLSYNSPLEVIIGLGMGGSGALLFGQRLISLFNRYQMARVIKAESDAKVEAYKAIKHVITGDLDSQAIELLIGGKDTDRSMRDAAETLTKVDHLEILPPA